ncbi:MerR family transcriptional regulator [Paenibacillus germinis]|uniref:MerR family transcriptional regulator n=1 Tax=Paenibacillus germinis TaxID=2654979 RepID=UPI0014909AAD|nr:MerR family transcriptional regulator [Paenibacillus germinis]
MYSVGQLSKETGITIRTLHYYDELGLLKPSFTTEAGYRYYAEADVMRLHEIVALKKMGFTLSKIKNMVADNSESERKERWKSSVTMELRAIRSELQRLGDLEKILIVSLQSMDIKGELTAEDLFLFIRSIQNDSRKEQESFRLKYFTEDELLIIDNLPQLGENNLRTDTWVRLLGDIRANRHEPPHSQVSQQLAKRVIDVSREFFQGNDELIEKYWNLVRPDDSHTEKIYGVDTDTMDYINRIVIWYEEHKEDRGETTE